MGEEAVVVGGVARASVSTVRAVRRGHFGEAVDALFVFVVLPQESLVSRARVSSSI